MQKGPRRAARTVARDSISHRMPAFLSPSRGFAKFDSILWDLLALQPLTWGAQPTVAVLPSKMQLRVGGQQRLAAIDSKVPAQKTLGPPLGGKTGRDTMSFRDNLQHLRATRNMTQEQLAMLVGVSRQSVTKWEAERAYPEMDKLIKLCDIFGCTIDELVKGDLTSAEPPEAELVSSGPSTDVCGYEEHMRSFSLRLACGVATVLAGAALAAFFEGVNPGGVLPDSDALSVAVLLPLMAAGLALIIPAALAHDGFHKAHPFVEDFYGDEERVGARRMLARGIVLGMAAIFVGCVARSLLGDGNASSFVMLLLFALGVGVIVYAMVMGERVNVEGYNEESLESLSEAQIVALVDEGERERILALKRMKATAGSVCAIIMLLATALALILLFGSMGDAGHGVNRMFWVPWPIGGVLCAVASVAFQAFGGRGGR